MPRIIVQAHALDGAPGVVTMAERAVPSRQQNDHYIAQLIERVGWAVLDAERLESQSIMSDPDGPALTRTTLTNRPDARTPGLAERQPSPRQRVAWAEDRDDQPAQKLRAAVDDGCRSSELEATFLASGETDDRIAAVGLYVWGCDAIRPRRDDLAARVSRRDTRPGPQGRPVRGSRAAAASPRHAHRAPGRRLRRSRNGSSSTPTRARHRPCLPQVITPAVPG